MFETYATLLGESASKKLPHKEMTVSRRRENIAITLYDTDILLFAPDNSVTLYAGEQRTKTTRERLNEYLPAGVRLEVNDREWSVTTSGSATSKLFYEGIRIALDARGKTYQAEGDDEELRERADKIKAEIKTYLAGLTQEVVKAVLEEDGMGDCMICGWELQDACPPEREHLEMHIVEKVYAITLLVLAFKNSGYQNPVIALRAFASDPKIAVIKRLMKRFLMKRLVPTYGE